jgi:cytochrome c
MEFNKIAGAVLVTLLTIMVIAKIGNTLVPIYYPPADKPGAAAPGSEGPAQEPDRPVAELITAANADDGRRRAQACVACHSFEKGAAAKQGPNLWDIVGRDKGSAAGFAYSPAMKDAPGEWTYEELFRYIGDPQAVVPGNKMAFRLPRAEHRAAVLAFLRTLSDSPKPMPAVEKKPDAPTDANKPAPPPPGGGTAPPQGGATKPPTIPEEKKQ